MNARTALFFASLTLAVRAAAAAPSNDHFAARIPLGSAASADATGTTVAATLESGENDLDFLGGRSVWWTWTAPADGWVTVDTAGSAIDTVLAVLGEGPLLKDTYTVGFNDESGDPASTGGSSRVVFLAAAGLDYHFSVHGFLAAQGAVAFHVRQGPPPPLELAALSLTPASVDITDAPATVTADLHVLSAADFTAASLILHRAGFNGTLEFPATVAQRISGTARDGIWRISAAIPRYSPAGTWLVEVALTDATGREAVYGRGVSAGFEYDHVLPDGQPGLISVRNTGAEDSTPPALTSFSLTPVTVNAVSTATALTATFAATDDLSGIATADLTLLTPAGEILTTLRADATHRTAGTALSGTWSLPFSFPARMPGGIWTLSLLLTDTAGNTTFYDEAGNGELFPAGDASARLTVTGLAHSYWVWRYPFTPGQPGADPDTDPDSDGVPNLLEYALGLDPAIPDAGALPAPGSSTGRLTLTYLRRRSGGLLYLPEFSSSLSTAPGAWNIAGAGSVTPVDESFERVTVSDSAPGGLRRFARLRVSLP